MGVFFSQYELYQDNSVDLPIGVQEAMHFIGTPSNWKDILKKKEEVIIKDKSSFSIGDITFKNFFIGSKESKISYNVSAGGENPLVSLEAVWTFQSNGTGCVARRELKNVKQHRMLAIPVLLIISGEIKAELDVIKKLITK